MNRNVRGKKRVSRMLKEINPRNKINKAYKNIKALMTASVGEGVWK